MKLLQLQNIRSGKVGGSVAAPSSKSMMQRAVAAGSQARGKTTIFSPSYSEDGKAALRIARALGSEITESPDKIEIVGGSKPNGEALNCGESGTSIRIFSALSALYTSPLTLIAEGSLTKRPLQMIVEPLLTLGARAETTGGFAPLHIHGPLHGGSVTVDGASSSQFLSGLLMTLPQCKENSTVLVPVLKSKPYVLMTVEILRDFGITIEHDSNLSEFFIRGDQHFTPREYTIEGDWSGASFLLVAGAIAGTVTITNLRDTSTQADRAIIEALHKAGAEVTILASTISITKPTIDSGKSLVAFEFDATECPDLFPPLVALASQCSGTTILRGASRLAHKESDRAATLKKEFSALGIEVYIEGDIMKISGGKILGGKVSSHHDHRIAMACAVAALCAENPVEISDADSVSKSFPDFFEVLEKLRIEG